VLQSYLESVIFDTQPLGAHAGAGATSFAVYTTGARDVGIRLYDRLPEAGSLVSLQSCGEGMYARTIPHVGAGALYKVVLDGEEVPDPYARYLPFGVHGPARVVATAYEPALQLPPAAHQWSIYELHVGTFSPQGTYRGVIDKLHHLVELGVSAIELLPVAAFAGGHGFL
jgi:maltooligosyltrehalose trehalohydrolase